MFPATVRPHPEFGTPADLRFQHTNVTLRDFVFGDLLFAVVNAARLYGVNPENALERTNRKFISRFNYLEAEAKKRGVSLKDMTLAEMDEIWDEAKRLER